MATVSQKKSRSSVLAGVFGYTISAFNNAFGDILSELMGLNIFAIRNFNALNHAIMEYQISRSTFENERILEYSGSSAYANGDPSNYSEVPYVPSYAADRTYLQFSDNISAYELSSDMSTFYTEDGRVDDSQKNNVFNTAHYYWDLNSPANDDHQQEPSEEVRFPNDPAARNSILYKTRKLFEQGKIKSIVSQFHTEGVQYNGQVATKYGESHGRNLLTKSAETGGEPYYVNGFDNPYCRVWTHHYQYDRLSKTMRANMSGINRWEGFEWTDEERKLLFPKLAENIDPRDENYDYAWRGEHNQSRRDRFTALDTASGLVKIAPKYINGGKTNIHTKDCMFSIENLAWKDYDPYSFTQALSWEQRGPLGGRIMWFPPYGLTFNETASANWNQNDFIGRGEKVYTYVNSERSGNLSFIMVTDHPSSIDYSSWWQDTSNEHQNPDKENDYHRYFAGCMGGINVEATANQRESGAIGMDEYIWNEDNISEKPTELTDEYIEPLVAETIDGNPPPPTPPEPDSEGEAEDKNPTTVEFFVFFPNNYSGINDAPYNRKSNVNAISYLLFGVGAQKVTSNNDGVFDYFDLIIDEKGLNSEGGPSVGNGYEMVGATIDNQISPSQPTNNVYIMGGAENGKDAPYVPDPEKKWYYRIDHKLDSNHKYVGKVSGENTIKQKLESKANYREKHAYRMNSRLDDIKDMFSDTSIACSFAEVACAWHSVMGNTDTADRIKLALSQNGEKNVETLISLFKDGKVSNITVSGVSSSHGDKYDDNDETRNTALARNRAKTILTWLQGYQKWNGIGTSDIEEVARTVGNKDVSSIEAKKTRYAHCIIEFQSSESDSASNASPIPESVQANDDFEPFMFVYDGQDYPAGTTGQLKSQDSTVSLVEFTQQDLYTVWAHDISDTAREWSGTSSYNTGDIVRYNGLFYKAKHSIQGKIPSSGNPSEYIEFPDFVPLTEDEVAALKANGIIGNAVDGEFFRKKNTKIEYIQRADGNGFDVNVINEGRYAVCADIWVRPNGTDQLMLACNAIPTHVTVNPAANSTTVSYAQNKLRYDQEYHFYKQYFADHEMVFKKLQEKIKYFNPVFHSMTPEGFNARLTFLHQCTRQGMTKTMGDTGGKTANNLAFGRPPYCVLRLGDFYNQLIVIENVTFDYSVSDGILWDLNTEGNGVQPMLCKVNISFKFIGGGDIAGPVRRLQNAMTFNYYANTSFYDNRADRVVYNGDNYATMGGAGNNVLDLDKSYAYSPKTYDSSKYGK